MVWLGGGGKGRFVVLFCFFKGRTGVLRRTKAEFLFQRFRVTGSEITFNRFLGEADVPCLVSAPYIYAGFRKQV